MRKYFISAITVCILLLLTGYQLQAINTDSLKQVLKQSNGNEKIDIQNKLSWNIKFNDPVRAKELSTKALFAASKADYKKGIMIANRNLAAIGFLQGKPDTCMHYAQIALDFAKELNDTFQQGKIYNLLGISYRKKHGITKALEYHNKAIQKFRLKYISKCLNSKYGRKMLRESAEQQFTWVQSLKRIKITLMQYVIIKWE